MENQETDGKTKPRFTLEHSLELANLERCWHNAREQRRYFDPARIFELREMRDTGKKSDKNH